MVAPLEQHWSLSISALQAAQSAKTEERTVTQWGLKRLWPEISKFSETRLIVSKANELNSEDQVSGNQFIPVDISLNALFAMIDKPSVSWKKILQRLTTTAERLLREEQSLNSGRQDFHDTLTITSVGSLSKLEQPFAAFGIEGMTMYPENVSFCSSIVTIYSLFGRLYFVFSGRNPLSETLRNQFYDIE
jgi:hypothetical protein